MKHVERLSLGIFHPAYGPIEYIKKQLQDLLPDNCHILASQRLGISLTRWYDGQNYIITDFATRDELIQVSRCWVGTWGWRSIVHQVIVSCGVSVDYHLYVEGGAAGASLYLRLA